MAGEKKNTVESLGESPPYHNRNVTLISVEEYGALKELPVWHLGTRPLIPDDN